jgi:prepilin-type N-terminal cleavage/methylation domain-containing protein
MNQRRSAYRSLQAGFTLTEVMLVLVVGAVLLASSLMLYGQLPLDRRAAPGLEPQAGRRRQHESLGRHRRGG